jgi:integrase
MPLTLYRRHTEDCKVNLITPPLSGKAKREYTACACLIWMTGSTDTMVYPRKSTGYRDWDVAVAKMRSLDADSKDAVVHGPTIKDCIERYMAARVSEVKESTAQCDGYVLGVLLKYANQHNVFFIRLLTVDLLEDFKTFGFTGIEELSKFRYISITLTFLRTAFRRGWIIEDLAERVEPFWAEEEQVLPFTKEEVKLILEKARKMNNGNTGQTSYPLSKGKHKIVNERASKLTYASNGLTFSLLLELLLETGMRCGDGVRFDPTKCVRGEKLWSYKYYAQKRKKKRKTTKAPRVSEVFLSDRLKVAIEKSQWMSTEFPFAYLKLTGVTEAIRDKRTGQMAKEVWRNMQTIGRWYHVDDCRPHRLRHTFAIRLLEKGWPIEDVSKLLNHAFQSITEKYYAAWVPKGDRIRNLERRRYQSLIEPNGD